jgi:hypothetical protein
MKSLALLLIAGLAVIALSGQASAVSFGGYQGPITMHLTDWDGGTQYNVSDGTYTQAQLAALTTVSSLAALETTPQSKLPYTNSGGSDSWGVVRIDSIIMGKSPGSVLYSAGQNGEQIVGIFYGDHDTSLTQTTSGTVVQQSFTGTGFQLAFFDYTPYVGTASFTGGPALGSGSTASPTYQGVTNSANLLWTIRAVPGFSATDTVDTFFNTFNGLNTTVSAGHSLGDMTGLPDAQGNIVAPLDFWSNGPQNAELHTLGISTANGLSSADVSFDFNAGVDPSQYFERGTWLLQSNDPIRTSVSIIPEPVTMAGLMLGLGCLTRYVRRRK